jgi:hypothetical protein
VGKGLILMPERDTTSAQVVWGYFNSDSVTRQHANTESPHLTRNCAEDRMPVFEKDTKGGIRKYFRNLALEFNRLVLCHQS